LNLNPKPNGILTVDVGTSSLKTALYNQDGTVQRKEISRYSYNSPQSGWAEGDPNEWWEAFKKNLSKLKKGAQGIRDVGAISFTGQMHTGILLDKNKEPIKPTILWLDQRADQEAEELRNELNLPPYKISSAYTIPKLLWLKKNHPEKLEKTEKILWPKDYLRFKLTGEVLTDVTEAGGSGMLNWQSKEWEEERVKKVGLRMDQLPPLQNPEEKAGEIKQEFLAEFGLSDDIEVFTGIGDVAALMGGAPPDEGRVTCTLGSSSMIFMSLGEEDEVIKDSDDRLYTYPLFPYFNFFGGVSSTTGAALEWVQNKITGIEERDKEFEETIEEALDVEPGSDGLTFIPYLSGERSPFWSDDIKGGFYGFRLSHDYRHAIRAVMEGIGFSLRHLLEIYNEHGLQPEKLSLAGGGADTKGWPQIIADVTQMEVSIFAGRGSEAVTRVLFALSSSEMNDESFKRNLDKTYADPEIVQPRNELEGVYSEGYQTYKELSNFALKQSEKL
jgi:xylulokinase